MSCARRDFSAFRMLYDRTSAKLLAVALRIVRDRSLAEDVVQDAYLKVWQGAASYSPEVGRPMTWLITIARNRAIDVVRSPRRILITQDDEGVSVLDAIADPRDRESEFVDADGLRRCLGGLEPSQRECFLAAYHDGFSREELSARFGRPVNTIKTWLHRSAHSLRLCLEAA